MTRTLALTNRIALAVGAASVALGAFAALESSPAHAYGRYSKTLTFTLSTTQPAPEDNGKWFIADSFSFGVEEAATGRTLDGSTISFTGLE